jgi:hypothetical protein
VRRTVRNFPARVFPDPPRSADGQVMIIFGLALFVLTGFIALSVDSGFLMAERRQTQSAADSGALAAAVAIRDGLSAESAGQAYGSDNADVPIGNVAVHVPPISGAYAGQAGYVQVVVEKEVDKFFVGAIYSGDWKVTASAVAGIEQSARPYALLVLEDPLDLRGTVSLTVNDGSIHVNDDITRSGTANTVNVDGTVSATGDIEALDAWQTGGIRPNLDHLVPDPLAGTPPPPKGPAVTSAMLTAAGFKVSGPKWVCAATCTLPAGYYDDAAISPTKIESGGTVILEPGIHYFDGNITLSASDTKSWIRAEGVLMYFDDDSTFEPGNGNFYLSAPCLTSTPQIASCSDEAAYAGGAAGMALWISKDNCNAFNASGNGNYTVEGVIYAPCSFVSMDGTPGTNGMQVIVGELQLRGTGSFTINYRDYVTAEYPQIYLVE